MVAALLAVVRGLKQAWLVELAGASLIVGGIYDAAGRAWALVAGGVALVLKSYEFAVRGDG